MATTTPRTTAPFRADVVGSFLRPAELKAARARFAAGQLDADGLRAVEDRTIAALVARQKAAGLQAVTDGEFRRSWWHLDFFWGLDGVEKTAANRGYQFHGEETRAETAVLTGKIRFGNHPFLAHYRYLRQVAGDDVLARQTIPAPAQFLAEILRPENRAATEAIYPNTDELIADAARAYRDALAAFHALGCRNLQLDDCTWGMLCDPNFRRFTGEAAGDALAQTYLAVNNAALADRPAGLTVTTHVCRGNYHSDWASAGGYAPVAKPLLGGENVAGYYLEYDTDRAGDFSPLREVSGEKLVVLGLVSSKTGVPEERETLLARIEEAAKFLPLDRLCLSPQCGFASTEEGNVLTEDQQWAKVALVRSVAAEVWGA